LIANCPNPESSLQEAVTARIKNFAADQWRRPGQRGQQTKKDVFHMATQATLHELMAHLETYAAESVECKNDDHDDNDHEEDDEQGFLDGFMADFTDSILHDVRGDVKKAFYHESNPQDSNF
jgi:hypothetical protein